MSNKIQYPASGRIKATGEPVTILSEVKVAGMPAYVVRFKDGFTCEWGRDKVVIGR